MSHLFRRARRDSIRPPCDRPLAGALEPLENRRLLAAHIVGSSTVYSTIQAAVDAASAGATITVDPGTYAEQVAIFKQLTVKGAQAGIDGRSNDRGTGESILTGADGGGGVFTCSFKIGASGVTIDGFTLQGTNSTSDTTGGAIVINPNLAGTTIINNVIQNNAAGILASNNSSTAPLLIQHNAFLFNNLAGPYTGAAIATNGTISGGNFTNVTIDSNFFFKNFGTTSLEPAINFQTLATTGQSNLRITNNVFDGNGKATLMMNTNGVTITGNVVTTCRDTTSGGLRFEGGMSNVTIQNNLLYESETRGIRIDNKSSAADNTAFTISNNNIFGNGQGDTTRDGLLVNAGQFAGTITASNNWWGAASGPSGEGPGTGDGVFLNGATGTFTPFLTSPAFATQFGYYGAPQDVNSLMEAENPDHGDEGISWHDSDSTNTAGRLHPYWSIDVDSSTDTDAATGYMLTTTRAGEWLEYTVNVPAAGTYSFNARVASSAAGGAFHLEVDGANVSGAVAMINTGSSSTWGSLTKTGINLPAGVHVLRLAFDTNTSNGGVGNWNWFKFTPTSVTNPPAAPSNLAASAANSTTVNLTWADNSNNETGFIIERKSGSTGTYAQIGTTTAANVTTFSDTTAAPNTTYFYHVRATGTGGDSTNSNEASATTPAGNTIFLSDLTWASATNGWGPVEKDTSVGSNGTGDGHTLTLNGVTYAKGLGAHAISDIIYNLNGGYATFSSDVGVDDEVTSGSTVIFQVFADNVKVFDSGIMTPTSITKTINLNIAGVQQLRLHVDDAGDGIDFDHADWAGASVGTASVQVPAAPSGLAASAASATQVNLSWTDVANETGYKIERSLNGTTGWTQIGTTLANVVTFNDTTATAGTQFFYRVKATNTGGDSTPSNVANATTPPAAPANLAASAVAPTQINLSWNDVTGETGFKIERSPNGTTGWTQIGTTPAGVLTYSDTTVVASTQYFYRVRGTNAGGDGAYSATANTTTPAVPTAPAAPSNLVASAFSSSRIDLTWTDNANNETGFVVERSPNGTDTWTQVGTPAANAISFSDTTGLAAQTQYWYRVRAVNGVGPSLDSNVATATTPAAPTVPAAPSNLVATAVSASQINLTWTDNANNETGFIVERSPDGSAGWTQVGTPAQNATSFSNTTGLSAGTQYFYRVRATNAVGPSANSNVASATTFTSGTLTYIATGAVWKYLDNGTNQGTAWRAGTFSDSTWKSGAAELGYGDGDETTVVSFGPDPNNKYITTYFRDAFNVSDPSLVSALNMRVLRDDGAVVYLNGTEVYRTNMPTGTIAYNTLASAAIEDPANTYYAATISPTLLVAGTNVIAVEVHQADPTSSDISFNFELKATVSAPSTPPAAPANLAAAAGGSNQINLTWSDVSNETSYVIERSPDGSNGWAQVGTTGANVITFSDTSGLSPSTQYFYRVRAVNSGGPSGNSNVANATTAALGAPSNLLATAAGTTQINLTWTDNASNETGYIVERSPNGNDTWTQVGTPAANATSFSNTGLTQGTQYFYRVRATSNGIDSANSNVANATTDLPTAPAAPSNLLASAVSMSQINLTWKDNSNNETGFIVERSPNGNDTWTQIATPAANVTSYNDTGLTASTQYFYRVRATNGVGPSGDSNVANATTQAAPTVPAAPSNLVATAVSSSRIDLTWTDNSNNETGFIVERSPDGTNTWTQVGTPGANATSFSNTTGLSSNTQYFYRVRATNAVGPSGDSNVANATTLQAPGPIPAPWTEGDIGSVGLAGSSNYLNGLFTVKGAGSDISNKNDSFHYVYQPWNGNGQIITRVASITNTSASAKAGIMFRETLGTSSRMAALMITPSGGIVFIRRTATTGNGAQAASTTVAGPTAPYWLKLIRNGSTLSAYSSTDGVNWTSVGSATVSMSTSLFVGLAVTSKSTSALNTSTFDNVTVSTSTSVNAPASAPASMPNMMSSLSISASKKEDPLAALLA